MLASDAILDIIGLTNCRFARVIATFNLLYSPKNPTSPVGFDLTKLSMMA